MYFTIYKTVNLLDGKYYIGMHQTRNLDDGYIGSGKRLKRAVLKHGIENFRCDIIFVFDNATAMYDKEKELVTEELVKDPNCYNLTVGGWGGNRLLTGCKSWSPDHMGMMGKLGVQTIAADPELQKRIAKRSAEIIKKAHAAGKIRYDTFTGRRHREDSKQRIKDALRGTRTGSKNTQFGLIWITDGSISKKINGTAPIPEGWRRGRK